MVEGYWLELLNSACAHGLYRTVLPLSGGKFNHFVAPDLFLSNICSSVHYSVVYNLFSVLAEKLKRDNK